jgi:hypothetical protein
MQVEKIADTILSHYVVKKVQIGPWRFDLLKRIEVIASQTKAV